MCVITLWVAAVMTTFFYSMKRARKLRAAAEAEDAGLDRSKHGGVAYDFDRRQPHRSEGGSHTHRRSSAHGSRRRTTARSEAEPRRRHVPPDLDPIGRVLHLGSVAAEPLGATNVGKQTRFISMDGGLGDRGGAAAAGSGGAVGVRQRLSDIAADAAPQQGGGHGAALEAMLPQLSADGGGAMGWTPSASGTVGATARVSAEAGDAVGVAQRESGDVGAAARASADAGGAVDTQQRASGSLRASGGGAVDTQQRTSGSLRASGDAENQERGSLHVTIQL